MIEAVALIVLGTVCVALATLSVIVVLRKPQAVDWTVAQSIAKSIVNTHKRGVAEGVETRIRGQEEPWPEELEEPLQDRVPYDPAQEAIDRQPEPDPDLVGVTDAPMEA